MNEKQIKAVTALSKAFAKCHKANLAFQGMDGSLLAFDADEYRRLTAEKPICDQQYVIADDGYPGGNQGEPVNTHDCYKDSGGW